MATVAEPKLLTAEEFLAADLGDRGFELVRGEIVRMPPTMPEHGRVGMKTGRILDNYGTESGYGYCLLASAVSTERGPDTVRGPDVSFYSHARWPESEIGRGLPRVPPDLVVEIVSPRNHPAALRGKIAEYLEAAVPLVMVVEPKKRRIALYRPGEVLPTF